MNCPSSSYSNVTNAAECTECEIGRFQNQEGQFFCRGVKFGSTLRESKTAEGVATYIEVRCPTVGVECNGEHLTYTGDVWHNPDDFPPGCTLSDPPVCTPMYVCVTDGCPERGAETMACKVGFKPDSPICAVCDEGYFPQLRTCKECGGSGPSVAIIALFVVALLVVLGLVAMVVRHRRFLASTGAFAHAKILVSFATIMLTVDSQFGIIW